MEDRCGILGLGHRKPLVFGWTNISAAVAVAGAQRRKQSVDPKPPPASAVKFEASDAKRRRV